VLIGNECRVVNILEIIFSIENLTMGWFLQLWVKENPGVQSDKYIGDHILPREPDNGSVLYFLWIITFFLESALRKDSRKCST
jgi:hypothetical protein